MPGGVPRGLLRAEGPRPELRPGGGRGDAVQDGGAEDLQVWHPGGGGPGRARTVGGPVRAAVAKAAGSRRGVAAVI